MAATTYTLEGVPLDLTRLDWPLYRGAYAREITLNLSLSQYRRLRDALRSSKGVAELVVTCSNRSGTNASKETKRIKGIRVYELVKRTDLTCYVTMADTRGELSRYIAVSSLNLNFRDGYVDGTEAKESEAALRKLVRRGLHLFAGDAFDEIKGMTVPDKLLTAGALKNKSLDYVLSQLGVDLWCGIDGLLRFAKRGDISGKPTKKNHAWLLGKLPGWETDAREQFRLPKKLRYYYRNRHMLLVPIIHDRSTISSNPLTITGEQRFMDEDLDKTILTPDELFAKYAPGVSYDDALIGKVLLNDRMQYQDGTDSPLSPDGSADKNRLNRILKRDWGRLFQLYYPDSRGAWGGWENLAIGVFKVNADGEVVEDLLPAGVRGNWAEFLNVVDGAGPNTILNQKVFANHDDPVPNTTTTLPTMPFAGVWENQETGLVRLTPQELPDGNTAMPGLVENQSEMTIRGTNQPVIYQGQQVYTRWQFHVPTHDKAQLSVENKYLLVVGTQRWPNDENQYTMIEVDGFPNGNVDFQEFEVPELSALYDFVDDAIPGRIDLQRHEAQGANGLGKQLNKDATQQDADTRAELFKESVARKFAGEGVAAGLSGLDEKIAGSIDEIVLNLDGVVVTTTIRCDNLEPEDARKRRAENRANERRARIGGKELQAV